MVTAAIPGNISTDSYGSHTPDYRAPVNINVQQAENGWIVRMDGQRGPRFWVAKDIANLVVLVEQLAKDFEEQVHIL